MKMLALLLLGLSAAVSSQRSLNLITREDADLIARAEAPRGARKQITTEEIDQWLRAYRGREEAEPREFGFVGGRYSALQAHITVWGRTRHLVPSEYVNNSLRSTGVDVAGPDGRVVWTDAEVQALLGREAALRQENLIPARSSAPPQGSAPTRIPTAERSPAPAPAVQQQRPWPAACPRVRLDAAMESKWHQSGAERGPIGCPFEPYNIGSPYGTQGAVATGRGTHPGGGSSMVTHRTGPHQGKTFFVLGCFEAKVALYKMYIGPFGFPTSDEYPVEGGRRQDFEGVYVFRDDQTGECEAYRPSDANRVTPYMPWMGLATQYNERVGERIALYCPPYGVPGDGEAGGYGTDSYHINSGICNAAQHAGRIRRNAGGVVTIEIRDGHDESQGSLRNGVRTQYSDRTNRNFVFVTANPAPSNSGGPAARQNTWPAACPRVRLDAPIEARWYELGAERSPVGCLFEPANITSAFNTQGAYATGRAAHPGGGSSMLLHRSGPHAGKTFLVLGCFEKKLYLYKGYIGPLGFPTGDEYPVEGGRRQDFEGVYMFRDDQTGECEPYRLNDANRAAVYVPWMALASMYSERVGERFTLYCPPFGAPGDGEPGVYGTDSYHIHSGICTSAQHAGRIRRNVGGVVTIEIRDGHDESLGTLRNGVRTGYGARSNRSFVFVDGSTPSDTQPLAGATTAPTDDSAVSFRGQNGRRFQVRCSGTPNRSARLWGSEIYSDQSNVCAAAVHAGVLAAGAGGTVTIEIAPALDRYVGSVRNGLRSDDSPRADGSFTFVRGAVAAPQPLPPIRKPDAIDVSGQGTPPPGGGSTLRLPPPPEDPPTIDLPTLTLPPTAPTPADIRRTSVSSAETRFDIAAARDMPLSHLIPVGSAAVLLASAGPSMSITPSAELRFADGVTVTLPFLPGALPDGVPPERLKVAMRSTRDGKAGWELLPVLSADAAAGLLRVRVTHFSDLQPVSEADPFVISESTMKKALLKAGALVSPAVGQTIASIDRFALQPAVKFLTTEGSSEQAAMLIAADFLKSGVSISFPAVGMAIKGAEATMGAARSSVDYMLNAYQRQAFEEIVFGGRDNPLGEVNNIFAQLPPFFESWATRGDNRGRITPQNLGYRVEKPTDMHNLWFVKYREQLVSIGVVSNARIDTMLVRGWPTMQKYWQVKRAPVLVEEVQREIARRLLESKRLLEERKNALNKQPSPVTPPVVTPAAGVAHKLKEVRAGRCTDSRARADIPSAVTVTCTVASNGVSFSVGGGEVQTWELFWRFNTEDVRASIAPGAWYDLQLRGTARRPGEMAALRNPHPISLDLVFAAGTPEGGTQRVSRSLGPISTLSEGFSIDQAITILGDQARDENRAYDPATQGDWIHTIEFQLKYDGRTAMTASVSLVYERAVIPRR